MHIACIYMHMMHIPCMWRLLKIVRCQLLQFVTIGCAMGGQWAAYHMMITMTHSTIWSMQALDLEHAGFHGMQ